ncbi:arsinothricin resistance N-acetyltransferase ArsN1 family A [Deinococcus sp. Leaf326]|jgi:phosphinothricin acetyltransferase|uniref:arsinothricin resistance N-acetyltransferase ArsN1 family A n=1 Tax=Deinococcus sp. Leaf326 TaxID=1736338 RepID=UPI0006F55D17|nr:arsinothricin resistance N-acetyltransferase ArsN1 family A [Deinococcus sp. Leaf326]KQR25688.1 GCN5 family acetyltransferase [Deinococcus sp. Leaf326]
MVLNEPRPARPADAPEIARIYTQGIEDRSSTFETRPRTADDVASWFDGQHPIVVVERQGQVIAFASTSLYRPRECYAGIAEFSVYVDRAARGTGAGKAAMQALLADAQAAGYWKLLSRVFPENTASRKLLSSLGFREVGLYERHGQLDGFWKDVVIVEKLL